MRTCIWERSQNEAEGLWADIAGHYIVFNLPSKSVLQLTSSQLDRALLFWDTAVWAQHNLRGTRPANRERIVTDIQPVVGYMRKCILS